MLTIRKFSREVLPLIPDRFRQFKFGDKLILSSLRYRRKNIIVSGGTGSSKFTVLNVLSAFIPDNERCITVRTRGELKIIPGALGAPGIQPQNIEGKGD